MQYITVNVNDLIGERLDKFISSKLGHLSRSKIKYLIINKHILVNETSSDPDYKIALGDSIKIKEMYAENVSLIGEDIKLDIFYEDEYLIVLNKPSGLVVHPGAGNKTGTLVQALIHHCGDSLSTMGDSERPGIVHRIDKDTSGLMVVAKDDFTHTFLSNQFEQHTITRHYIALIWGILRPQKSTIETLITRSNRNRKKMMSSSVKGKKAVTHYETIDSFLDLKGHTIASLVKCSLETGRTHQIRVHLSEYGNPVIGDKTYGRNPSGKLKYLSANTTDIINGLTGQCLHAQSLGFIHPKSKKNHIFQCDIPENLSNLINSIKTAQH